MHPLVLSALLTMAAFSLFAGVDAWAARRRRDAARRRLSSSPRRIRGGFAGGEVGRRPRTDARPSPDQPPVLVLDPTDPLNRAVAEWLARGNGSYAVIRPDGQRAAD